MFFDHENFSSIVRQLVEEKEKFIVTIDNFLVIFIIIIIICCFSSEECAKKYHQYLQLNFLVFICNELDTHQKSKKLFCIKKFRIIENFTYFLQF